MSGARRASSRAGLFLGAVLGASSGWASSLEVTNQLTVDGNTLLNGSATVTGTAAPVLSAAGQGAFYFDSTSNRFMVSENGGGYTSLVPFQRNSGTGVVYPSVLTDLVGVGTASPLLPLDVNGAAQFGPGATKSTFTAAGVLQLAVPLMGASGGTWNTMAGAGAGALPFFAGAGVMAFLPAGTAGYVLQSNGAAAPSWASTAGLTAGSATTAQNLSGGIPGALPYQSAPNTTLFTAAGTAGQLLQSGGAGTPNWTSSPTVPSVNVTGGAFSVGGSTLVVSGGQVGVGTAAPAGLVHVMGTTYGVIVDNPDATKHLTLRVGGANKWTAYILANDLRFFDTTDRMTMMGGGLLGIGTISPTGLLDVRGTLAAGTVTLDQANVAGNKFARFTTSGVTGTQGSIGIQANAIEYAIGPSVTNMAVTGGNLGVGTLAPNQLLDVNGAAQFGSGATKSTFTAAGLLQLASPLAALYGGTGADLSAATAGALPYFSGAGVMSALGPGTPGYVLQANGAAAPSWAALTGLTAGSATTAQNLSGGAAGTLPFQTAANTTNMLLPGSAGSVLETLGAAAPMWITAPTFSTLTVTGSGFSVGGSTLVVTGGNVGIKTASPGFPLSVGGAIASGAPGTGGIWVDGGTSQFFGSVSATTIGLWNAGWNLVLNNAGSVGIGTTAPATRLHLSSGTVTIDGNAATSLATNGAVGIGTSSVGPTLVVKSTSSTLGTTVADIRDNAGSSLVSVINSANGSPIGTATLLVNADNAANAGGLIVNNLGSGSAGLFMNAAGGGGVSLTAFDTSPTMTWTNKHAKFLVNNNAYDGSSIQSWLFYEASQPAYLPEFVIQEQAGQTGDVMQWQNSSGIAVASVTASGSIVTSASMTAAGTVTAAFQAGDGSLLTNLNANNVTSGTLPGARLSGAYTNALTFGSAAGGPIAVSTELVVSAAQFQLGNFAVLPSASAVGPGAVVYRTTDHYAFVSDGSVWTQLYTGAGGPWIEDGLGHVTLVYSSNSVGVGVVPLNKLDISSGLAVGAYAGVNAAPLGGAIISGTLGIGLTNPSAWVSVNGTGAIGFANNPFYDLAAGWIAAGNTLYSYGSVCAGNSSGACSGVGGNVFDAAAFRPGTNDTNSIGTNALRFNKGWFGGGGLDLGGSLQLSGGNYRVYGPTAASGLLQLDTSLGSDLEYPNYGRFLGDSLGAHILAGTGSGVSEYLTVRGSGSVGVSTTSPVALFAVGASGTLVATGGSAVGIGKASPVMDLDILAPNGGAQVLSGAAGSYAAFQFGRTAADGTLGVAGALGQFASNSFAGDLVLRVENPLGHLILSSGSPGLVITNGAVGVAKTGPATALDVNGTATATLFSGVGTSLVNLNASNIMGGLMSAQFGGTGANLSGASLGQIPYFLNGGVLAAVGAGTSGQLLSSNGGVSAPSWLSQSSLVVPLATNVAGGAAGSVPYQTGANTTGMLAAGPPGALLQANGAAAPSWILSPTFSTVTVTGAAFSVGGSSLTVGGGQVGIGTAAASFQLTVAGGANGAVAFCSTDYCLTGFASNFPVIKETGGPNLYFDIAGAYSGFMDNTGMNFHAYKDYDNPVYYIDPAAATSAVLAGNVGIGLTPTLPLEVAGVMRAKGAPIYLTQAAPSDTLILDNSTAGSARIYLNSANNLTIGANSSTTQLVLLANGNVGVGGSPAYKLDVQGGWMNASAGFAASGYQVLNMSGSTLQHGAGAPVTDQSFLTAGVERLHINASGNVGIGTGSSATSRLNVQGVDSTSSNEALSLYNSGLNGLFFVRDDKTAGFGFGPADASTPETLTVKGQTNDATTYALQVTQASYAPILMARDDLAVAIGANSFLSTLTVTGGVTVATNTTAAPALYVNPGTGNVGLGTSNAIHQLTLTRNLAIPSVSTTTGVFYEGFVPYLHGDQIGNFFAGQNVGNLAYSGANNVALGGQALAGLTSGASNVAIGPAALASLGQGGYNVGIGPAALYSVGGSSYNVAIGYESCYQCLAGYNVAIGALADFGAASDSGTFVTAVGYAAAQNNTQTWTTAVGYGALTVNSVGVANSALGTYADYYGTGDGNTSAGYGADMGATGVNTGTSNSAVGYAALYYNASGADNEAFGVDALYSNSSGANNVALGATAGYGTGATPNTTGSNNTFIGYQAGPGAGTFTNATAIGYNATVNESNALILGSGANVGIGLSNPAYIMETQTPINNYSYVHTNGTIFLGTYMNSVYNSGMIGTISAHPFQIFTSNGGPVMTLAAGGTGANVGINTTAPGAKLTVAKAQVASLASIESGVANHAYDADSPMGAGNVYLPGLVWNTTDNNNGKPKAGVWAYVDGTGSSQMQMGTSNNYAAGITNQSVIISAAGYVGLNGAVPTHPLEVQNPSPLNTSTDGSIQAYSNGGSYDNNAVAAYMNANGTYSGQSTLYALGRLGGGTTTPNGWANFGAWGHQYGTGAGGWGLLATYGANPVAPTTYAALGGASLAGYFSGQVESGGALRLDSIITCISGSCPTNNAVRMTPNFHWNAMPAGAVIANWDNGTTGHTLNFRVGNMASGDAFDVWADGYFGLQASSTLQLWGSQAYDHGDGGLHLLGGSGYVQFDNPFSVTGNVSDISISNGALGLTGDLPGYPVTTYPTLKSGYGWLYFSAGNSFSAYMPTGGTWNANSSRYIKENFVPVNGDAILSKLDRLPMAEWNYKGEDSSMRHIGPMAQDFHELFGLNGPDDKMISHIDPSGVALAGVKALSAKAKARQERIELLKREIKELKAELEKSKEAQ